MHCSAAERAKLDCNIVAPGNSHPSANRLMLVDDGKTLLANDIVHATTTVYDVEPVSNPLSVRKTSRRSKNQFINGMPD